MYKGMRHTGLACLAAAMLLAASSGCIIEWIVLTNAGSFGAGWLLGRNDVSVTRECFLNGEPIDCADVSD